MKINIKYFASLAEQLDCREQQVEVDVGASVVDVWRCANGCAIPDNVLHAVNYEYVASNQEVVDGDEVAFFPPVTGG